jgi:hypothetical protein
MSNAHRPIRGTLGGKRGEPPNKRIVAQQKAADAATASSTTKDEGH